jgi:hypothetical protein
MYSFVVFRLASILFFPLLVRALPLILVKLPSILLYLPQKYLTSLPNLTFLKRLQEIFVPLILAYKPFNIFLNFVFQELPSLYLLL